MNAFVTVCSSFLLLSLLYARLTGGNYVLFPVGWNLRAEMLVWWVLFCLACHTLGTGIWRLLVPSMQKSANIALGAGAGTVVVCGVCWFAHYLDPVNEAKMFRIVFPRWLAGATALLAIWASTTRRKTIAGAMAPEIRTTSHLQYWPGPAQCAMLFPRLGHLTLAGASIGLGLSAWFMNRRTDLLTKCGLAFQFQLFELVCLFMVPAVLLEWVNRTSRFQGTWLVSFASRIATVALMGVAAFAT